MTDRLKCVSISQARQLANDHGMTRLLILGIDDRGNYAFTTFGRTKKQCDAMRIWADRTVPGLGRMMNDATND